VPLTVGQEWWARLARWTQAALAKGVGEEPYDRVVEPLALTHGGSADVRSNGKQG
jgi:hypothetical protein